MENYRLALIALIAFVVSFASTYIMIPFLKKKQFGQYIREEGPKAHASKAGTPTMGGIAIIAGAAISILLSGFITGEFNSEKLAIIATMIGFGIIGFIDDYNKIAKRQSEGLTPRGKMILQILFGVLLAAFMMIKEGSEVFIPFAKVYVDFGWFYIPFVAFILVAMSNAVNLSDGLDGLASSLSAIVAVFFAIIGMSVIPSGNEAMAVSGNAIMGAAVGFLMLNKYPARIFMGDTGSMALGGAISATAIVGKMEWLLPIAGAIFVIEALSVLIQVTYFKKTGGKRIFRMAPLHHHFELGGWSETKVVAVFTVVTAIACAIAFDGLW